MDNMDKTDKTDKTEDNVKNNITNKMDDLNKQALNILQTKGEEEAIKFMFNPTGDKPLSYAEMRYRFG